MQLASRLHACSGGVTAIGAFLIDFFGEIPSDDETNGT